MQVVGITTKTNHRPMYNYRSDSRHEEENEYVSYEYGYRTADDIESRLGVNDGYLLRYGPSTTEETIQRYQPHHN